MHHCKVCNYETNQKTHLVRHINSNKHQEIAKLTKEINDEDNEYSAQAITHKQPQIDNGGDDIANIDAVNMLPGSSPEHEYEEQYIASFDLSDIEIETFTSEEEDDSDDDDDDDNDEMNDEQAMDTLEGMSWDDSNMFWPFPNEGFFLLYVLWNSQYHPITEAIMKFMISTVKSLTPTSDVPSLEKLKRFEVPGFESSSMITKSVHEGHILHYIRPSQIGRLVCAHPVASVEINENGIAEICMKVFSDDMSTNKSRRWSPMGVCQLQPRDIEVTLRNDFTFISCVSTTVSLNCMVDEIIKDMQASKRSPLDGYSASNENLCKVVVSFAHFIADMKEQSSLTSHLGPSANFYCPKCKVCKPSMELAEKRTKEFTLEIQGRMQTLNKSKSKSTMTSTGVKEGFNPLFSDYHQFDPHKKIPSGKLHVFYLGIVKQFATYVATVCNNLQVYLQSLSSQIGANFVKYMNSRQGKDFKNFVQVAPFALLLACQTREIVECAVLLSKLTKLVENGDSSEAEIVQEAANKYIESVMKLGVKTLQTPKLHALKHLKDDIEGHGPMKDTCEDMFESKHKMIRNGLFRQNCLARSRDTAKQQAKCFTLQHLVTGGFVLQANKWRQAGEGVLNNPKALKYLTGRRESTEHEVTKAAMADRDMASKKVLHTVNPFNEDDEGKFHIYSVMKGGSCRVSSGEGFSTGENGVKVLRGIVHNMDTDQWLLAYNVCSSIGEHQVLDVEKIKINDNVETMIMPDTFKPVQLICCCDTNRCTVTTRQVFKKEEQQLIKQNKKVIEHHNPRNLYYINNFKFKSLDKYF